MARVRYILSGLVLFWALGFLWFAAALPQPADAVETDAVIVPTGGAGRIAQGLDDLLARDGHASVAEAVGTDRARWLQPASASARG